MTYATTINVDAKRVQDIIITAFEGGSNYWLGRGRVELIEPKYEDMPEDGVVWYGNSKRNVFAEPDFEVTIVTPDDGKKLLNAAVVKRGLQIMQDKYPQHFADLLNETDDGDTADVFLQCCLFEELVYG